jgi:SulP family sulfate permease
MLKSFRSYQPRNLASDITAGVTTTLVTIPDGLASAILAGVNPVHGLYGLMVGTPIAALTLSSQFMFVANTGAIAVAVGEVLVDFQSGPDQISALVTLTLLAGIFQLALGVLKLGWITRYVSNAVLVGFMSGIALLIILGQVPNLTGFQSTFNNKVLAALDTFIHPGVWHLPTFVVGLVTVLLIVILKRTRLSNFNMIIALLAGSALGILLNSTLQGYGGVYSLSDIADIPRGFPQPRIPDLSLVLELLAPAMAIGLVGLIQAAGVSRSVPNADGSYPDASQDFLAQGFANAATGVFQGLPVGGTMSETSVNISSGAKTRLASLFSGLLIIVLVILFSQFIELVALPAVGALLVVAGFEAIKIPEIEDVRDTGAGPRYTMLITFIATLIVPIQYAVMLGVVLSILIYLYRSSTDIRLVQLLPQENGSLVERQAPLTLASQEVTILRVYGSLHFSGAVTLEERLPAAQNSDQPVVILQLRGLDNVGSTFIRVVERYAEQLEAASGALYLAGVHPHVLEQLELTETTESIPRENIFLAEDTLGTSTGEAYQAAHEWLKKHIKEDVDPDQDNEV